MFIQRHLTDSIERLKHKFPILAVTGPRQSGKTTLLRSLFPTYQYVTLEDPETRERALTDPRGFLKSYHKYAIFDEVQRVPHLFSYLQGKVDEDKLMGQYILSGSQNFQLLEQITQSLAGRVALFKLLPFTFSEIDKDNLITNYWHESAFKGFYPAVYDRNIEPTDYYRAYVETYIERDVRQLINVKDLRQFRLFLKYCAGNVGQTLNYVKLGNDIGISLPTVKSWLSVLETSYILFSLPPYFKNYNKRLIKTPKIYFYDTGLVCYLLEITRATDLETYYQRGAIFENLLVADLHKLQHHQMKNPDFYFWRDSNGLEIDLLCEQKGELNIFEMKSAETINSSFFTNLQKFKQIAGNTPQIHSFLLYGGTQNLHHLDTAVCGWQHTKPLLIGPQEG